MLLIIISTMVDITGTQPAPRSNGPADPGDAANLGAIGSQPVTERDLRLPPPALRQFVDDINRLNEEAEREEASWVVDERVRRAKQHRPRQAHYKKRRARRG